MHSLILQNNGITGTLPSFLGALSKLTRLVVVGNQMSGTLPTELFSGAQLLGTILFGDNSFRGTLPTEVGQLPLKDFRVENNALTGAIPTALGTIQGIRKWASLLES